MINIVFRQRLPPNYFETMIFFRAFKNIFFLSTIQTNEFLGEKMFKQ